MATYFTIQDIRNANAEHGHHWFEPATLRFFKSKVYAPVVANMFVSSEQGPDGIRRYTIRRANDDGSIDTVDEFQQFPTKRAAVRTMQRLAHGRCRACNGPLINTSAIDSPWECGDCGLSI